MMMQIDRGGASDSRKQKADEVLVPAGGANNMDRHRYKITK